MKITRQELNECLISAVKRVINESKSKKVDTSKPFKKANREIEREFKGDGFKSYDRPHKDKKNDYVRKPKHKLNFVDDETED